MNTGDFRFAAIFCWAVRNGLGRINSEVSYQLDHAPESRQNIIRVKLLLEIPLAPRKCFVSSRVQGRSIQLCSLPADL